MKKLITKYWGLVLVVVLISSLFVSVAPVSAANYAFSADLSQPSIFSGGLLPPDSTGIAPMVFATYNVYATAQTDATVYAVLEDTTGGTGVNALYKSADGGNTWAAAAALGMTAATAGHQWKNVAVSPTDPNFVVVIDDIGGTDNVWVSQNGGFTFSMLTAPTIVVINSVTISGGNPNYIAIGGVAAGGQVIQYWTLGTLAGAWTGLGLPAAAAAVAAIEFSPNFAADLCLVAVTTNATATNVEVYSFNGAPLAPLGWNPVGYNFPRRLHTGAAIAVVKASLALDPAFYLGDESTQVGFIGAAITDTTEFGGVWRFDYAAAPNNPLTKILGTAIAGTAINSVAWDGTNLMAAVLGAAGQQAISRSANALSAFPAFAPVSAIKAPYGISPLVYFNGGAAYCLTGNVNGGVAKSMDLGKTWDGIALLATSFATISDFWMSTDGTRSYYVVDDASNIDIWRKSAGVWTRIAILPAAAAGTTWLVRADNDVPNTVYVGNKGANVLYKSLDAGATWTTRAAGGAIQDFAVQDANTVYVAVAATQNVIKSTTGAFTWSAQAPTGMATFGGGNCYSLNLIATDKLLVGGTTGGVAYSADGSTTWAAVPALIGAANNIVTASGLAAGDTIWAGGTGGAFGSWVIGVNIPVPGWNVGIVATSIDGLAYVNGSLFVLDSGVGLYKYLYPTGPVGVAFGVTDTTADVTVYAGGTSLNSMQYAIGSSVLWVRSIAAIDGLLSFTDHSIGPAQAPTPTAPINGSIVQINSINGGVNNFQFMWDAPSIIAATPGIGYTYDLQVYLDELGTIPVAGSATVPTGAATFGVANTISSAAGTVAFAGIPGTTYYWRVRVDADGPAESYWSPMATFTVQQLQAIVPVLSSPQNGTSIAAGLSPAFSWNPIASAATYKFELSADPQFSTTLYSTVSPSAGASIPVSVKLVAEKNYFWRVKVLTPAEGDWSAVANFSIAAEVVVPPPTTQVTPTLTVVIPPQTTTSIVITQPPQPADNVVNPSYIWAIIIIGAVLVIAVIVLIVRTRRSV